MKTLRFNYHTNFHYRIENVKNARARDLHSNGAAAATLRFGYCAAKRRTGWKCVVAQNLHVNSFSGYYLRFQL